MNKNMVWKRMMKAKKALVPVWKWLMMKALVPVWKWLMMKALVVMVAVMGVTRNLAKGVVMMEKNPVTAQLVKAPLVSVMLLMVLSLKMISRMTRVNPAHHILWTLRLGSLPVHGTKISSPHLCMEILGSIEVSFMRCVSGFSNFSTRTTQTLPGYLLRFYNVLSILHFPLFIRVAIFQPIACLCVCGVNVPAGMRKE